MSDKIFKARIFIIHIKHLLMFQILPTMFISIAVKLENNEISIQQFNDGVYISVPENFEQRRNFGKKQHQLYQAHHYNWEFIIMSLVNTKRVITNGLVALLDAGNVKSFSGEPTANSIANGALNTYPKAGNEWGTYNTNQYKQWKLFLYRNREWSQW